jgi:hypothetical protein
MDFKGDLRWLGDVDPCVARALEGDGVGFARVSEKGSLRVIGLKSGFVTVQAVQGGLKMIWVFWKASGRMRRVFIGDIAL